ncbi:hypothetical protein JHK82_039846 [Glycine max]|nr:hypothetical protein JHK82_039846 [Glycine max]
MDQWKLSHIEKLEKLERRKILELSLDGGGVGHELEGEEGGDFQLHSSLREICMSDIVEPNDGVVPSSAIEPPIGEGGQPTNKVDHNDNEVVEVTPNMPSSVLTKRKRDDETMVSGHNKSRALLSFAL